MALNIAQKLIERHRVSGGGPVGAPLSLRIDQTLTQDATGTLAMLSLEAMELDRVKTEVSVQYVDHNLLQIDNLNAEDHLFLESACRRYGIWYSRPGNGTNFGGRQTAVLCCLALAPDSIAAGRGMSGNHSGAKRHKMTETK